MTKSTKIIAGIFITGAVIAVGVAYYLFNMPHRDVQATKTDFSLTSTQIVNEYFADATKANEKYLDSEGESKIIEVTGVVSKISDDFNANKVVLLKAENDKAGVSCTFTPETNAKASTLKIGEQIILKGVIRSGASYDEDLEMYEDAIMEKCDLITKSN